MIYLAMFSAKGNEKIILLFASCINAALRAGSWLIFRHSPGSKKSKIAKLVFGKVFCAKRQCVFLAGFFVFISFLQKKSLHHCASSFRKC